ncbi:EexN family lipoprotein [Campylobacter sp. LH-2024]|uniref:EexN family lipoprotein n=1 Tax=Campylobacter molothri TaxID=1032242 RepID=A0ACC5W1E3_9BACT|nr:MULTISPECIES: EexN family lipoprotein [unclassified Campylobacter]MBZ7928412.1 EexN family lipoprotein [Campylobacter sp. RM10542]MBZ7933912.1 EexN family lipoprotein [Campylobacter sp. W0065]MBZ7937247.1 EexN family lipoprotein [Campylobacter sp. RM10538]MBZ7941699.1 EexN family lipoprotein [Campylobacter sp. W0045]MBZ7943472.1 EexN family lipoprotein [Campylobacter sp. RM13744]MBZ7944715.1 EexN family lipoprotein [Campylobacter sp. RM10532]MBZ7947806.1 EexN family lipoprotein [Campyloba
MLFLLITSIMFNACEQTKSVEYYKTHPQEAKKKSDECRLKSIISQDCVNAFSVAIPKEDWDDNESLRN